MPHGPGFFSAFDIQLSNKNDQDLQRKDTVINNHPNKPLANGYVTANSDMWSNLNEVISHLAGNLDFL